MPDNESEYEVLMHMLEVYEKILHPDFFGIFKTQLYKVYEENKKQAYAAAKISDDALWIEQQLTLLKDSMKYHTNNKSTNLFLIKCLYKDFLKRLLNE